MNHISIEGMDGVGKTTICKLLSEKLNYRFVEKPLHLLFDDDLDSFDNYIRIRNKVNKNDNRVFTSWFYGLGSIYMYEYFKNENIITDRHFASNYAWSGTDENNDVYELLLKKIGAPKLTVILYATPEVIISRLKSRNINDKDIHRVDKSEMVYSKMISFCNKFKLPYILIDTSNLTPKDIVDKIIMEISND